MAVTSAFHEAINSGNISTARIMMTNSLLEDPEDFNEMERLASGVRLYDEHDGQSFEEDRNKWNDAYVDKLMVQAKKINFSRERISHLKEVVRYLHPVQVKTAQPNSFPSHGYSPSSSSRSNYEPGLSDYERQKREDEHKGNIIRVVQGGIFGAVAGGVVGGGLAVAAEVATGVVVASVAAGAVVGAVAGVAITSDK